MSTEPRELSVALQSSLERRHASDSMFSLCQLSANGDNHFVLSERHVPKSTWCKFARLLRTTYVEMTAANVGVTGTAVAPHQRSLHSCDIGLLCSETFFAGLAESVCLCAGWSFCVFNPEDPPHRRERLIQQRSPVLLLTDAEIDILLSQAEDCEEIDADLVDEVGLLVASLPDSAVAYYIYTSGSTGEPKCIIASRRNLWSYMNHFAHHPRGLAATDHSRFLTLSTPHFDSSIGDMATVLLGAHSVLMAVQRAAISNGDISLLLPLTAPTHVVSTPAVWGTISPRVADVMRLDIARRGCAATKVFLGGEKMPQRIIDHWAASVELYNIYGVTEATVYQCLQRVFPGSLAADVTCGSGVGTRVCIDNEEGAGHTEGCVDPKYGEVVLFGEQVCLGYADEQQQQRQCCEASGDPPPSPFGIHPETGEAFFRTGDVGCLIPATGAGVEALTESGGVLIVRGRRDWQVKVNGQRVALEEVEQVVRSALGKALIQCCCCCCAVAGLVSTDTGQETEVGGEESGRRVIGILCELDCDCGGDCAAFLDHAAGVQIALRRLVELRLPSFMVPRLWLLQPRGSNLPQTPTGKLDRNTAAQWIMKDTGRVIGLKGSSGTVCKASGEDNELYTLISAAWESIFGIRVTRSTNFFHAGGDSLGALKLTRQVYISVNGSDSGIDEHGILPAPFRPHVLLRHPRLEDYVAAVRWEMTRSNVFAQPQTGEAMDQSGTPISPTGGDSIATHGPSPSAYPMHSEDEEDALLDVVAVGGEQLVALLLEESLFNVNGRCTRTHRCTTPLHVAVNAGNAGIVRLLLAHQAKLTSVNQDGVTPAHLAASVSCEILELLLAHGAALQCRDARQQSLLHFAARAGNTDTVRYLLFIHHMDLRTRDKWQRSPAHWAALNGHSLVLEVMVEYQLASKERDMGSREPQDVDSDVGKARQFRRGAGSARYTRLAQKKTNLSYESLRDIAIRVSPGDCEMLRLCSVLSEIVEA